jgi:hypothetical protein
MLEVIGAGTSNNASAVDFHAFYKESELFVSNSIRVDELCSNATDNHAEGLPIQGDNTVDMTRSGHLQRSLSVKQHQESKSSFPVQFYWLMKRVRLRQCAYYVALYCS